jgi:transposase
MVKGKCQFMKGLTLSPKEQARSQTLNQILLGRLSAEEAAPTLGLSQRQVWRLLAAYREEGAAALAHHSRGRQPSNATPESVRQQVIELARSRYAGCNHTHFTELLAEREGIFLARATVSAILRAAGVASPRRRRPPQHRCRRQRMPQEGMLLQLDGSPHPWLEERGPKLTLLLAVDDATGTAPYALFQEQEDTQGYFRLLQGVIQRRGVPLAVYTDRHTVFRQARPAEAVGAGEPTQFGRALRELGITPIFAHSPEAKGRVERANGTFQDRLVTELRLAGAASLEEADRVLAQFLPRFNARFGVPAAQPEAAYRELDSRLDLAGVLCFKEARRVAKDNTVRYQGQTLQLFPGPLRRSYARARVEVQERLDGSLVVACQGQILLPQAAPPLATELRAAGQGQPAVAETPPWEPLAEVAADAAPPEPLPKPIWYKDPELRRRHQEAVKAGLAGARQRGITIGRPAVTQRPGFAPHLASVLARLEQGGLSRRKAARELEVGYATLLRLIAAHQPTLLTKSLSG